MGLGRERLFQPEDIRPSKTIIEVRIPVSTVRLRTYVHKSNELRQRFLREGREFVFYLTLESQKVKQTLNFTLVPEPMLKEM